MTFIFVIAFLAVGFAQPHVEQAASEIAESALDTSDVDAVNAALDGVFGGEAGAGEID
ncbi:hypothetical protein QO034_18965 [Sedimentitalea sp. JM2-8]|uniref:Uncharacterized protein n=1 Tax=Sedimentitalea xiamensis TaxID=3050037 RepID=A0ABT7FJ70_9RHOB|nr:hypothetical protein [Sedimentitalea xiamensis]MDK3075174.1 hypothetical protein [Sedimentitalea xiamensis]